MRNPCSDKMEKEQKKLLLMGQFRDLLVEFTDELIEQYPREGDFIMLRIFLKDQLPISDVIGKFIRDFLPLEEKALKRDKDFFIQNFFEYSGVSNRNSNRVNHLLNFVRAADFTQEDMDALWKWIDVFFKIAKAYHREFGFVPRWEK